MHGKNTGKKALRPSKDRSDQCLRPILQKPTRGTSNLPNGENGYNLVSLPKPLGDELAYFTFPVPLNAEMTFLIRRCKRV